ncbi:enoyl-CoA hydratase domain-containing protein 3, mitochondrial [Episyrphus balteatus]|uniref:enoyl-CoA hydratase domain-containing protein 3, mitochondrial n=1 Tax=Episyrphus balteatus TaxID=286459 RepID=UPI00248597C3|nr:enoyl-CoA hydratase domain-containing protein 3, mitochondrial [Episyrphus balteatus]
MLSSISRNFSSVLKRGNLINTLSSNSPVGNEELAIISENDGVREIQLNRPKTRNPLSMGMMESILQGITENVNDKSLRCIVISSTGPVFSAGHNLNELKAEKGSDCQRKVFDKCAELIHQMQRAPVPIIAKVDGLAAAAGCQFVASCDMIICTERSSFSTPAASFGIFCHTPAVAISRVMPRMKSSYMLFTGFPISAKDAYISGLVSAVTPNDKLDEEVNKICDSIKSKSRPVIQLGKEFYYKQMGLNLSDAYVKASEVMVENLGLNDGKEGLQSFLEKRKPKWSHS